MENNELYLVYAERINYLPNSNGLFEYELYFSETPEIAWGEDWNQQCPSACNKENLRPESTTYNIIKRLESDVVLACVGDNSCFSIQDCSDNIIPCMWEDLSECIEYPSPIRLIFHFGESMTSIIDKLKQRNQSLI